MSIFSRRPGEDVETEKQRLIARADAQSHQEMVRRLQRNADRQERAEARRLHRAEKAQRRRERALKVRAGVDAVRQRLILVLPLLGVNVLALGGQIGFATKHLGWNLPEAVVFGGVLESIAVYIGWHAHQALLSGDSAIKLRASSYLMGAIVGGLNYEHFARKNFMPTASSVVFGLMSLTSPWLWAMHGRYANRKRLRELGLIDERAPHFSGGRWVHFPVQTWGALRWGIANNVQDPAKAWEGYQRARRAKKGHNQAEGATSEGHDGGATTGRGHNLTGGHNSQGHKGATVPGPRRPQESGATTGGTGHNGKDVAPREVAPPSVKVAPATPVAPVEETAVAPATGDNLVEFTPRGETQAAMRTHWDGEIAQGRIPSGADLNRAVGKDPKYSLGKRYAKDWRQALPEEFIEAVEAGRTEEARKLAADFSTGERKAVAQ